jgi:hypothetical protein
MTPSVRVGGRKLNEEMRSTCQKRKRAETIIKDFFRNAEKEKGWTDWQGFQHLSKHDCYDLTDL